MHVSRLNLPGSLAGPVIGLCLHLFAPTAGLGAPQVTFQWAPSTGWNAQGEPLPPAVAYEVWLAVDHGAAFKAATISGTTWGLSAEPGRTYNICVRGIDAAGNKSPMSQTSDDYAAPSVTAVASAAPAGLASVYPNPFNPVTVITFHVPEGLTGKAPLSLEVFDTRGRLVRRFHPDRLPGTHSITWDGKDVKGSGVPSGVYLARYVCGAEAVNLKMTLVR